jgi:hypothetical protein
VPVEGPRRPVGLGAFVEPDRAQVRREDGRAAAAGRRRRLRRGAHERALEAAPALLQAIAPHHAPPRRVDQRIRGSAASERDAPPRGSWRRRWAVRRRRRRGRRGTARRASSSPRIASSPTRASESRRPSSSSAVR